MTNILVTGGAGYIGSHTCKALKGAGFSPVTYDSLVYGHEWAVKWGPLEIGDILDTERLSAVVRKYRPRAVVHFAAFAYVGESVTDPAKYYRNNVIGTLSLLDAMRTNDVTQIVFSSTCATYGMPDVVPMTEETPQHPINPYGATKLMIERIIGDYYTAYGLSSVSLRYFNAAGADPDGETGEDHDPETHLIPLVLAVAAGERRDISVFGRDYDTPDGTCVRDYTHVADLADAHVRALNKLETGRACSAYNLGTGKGISVAEVIDAARRVTARDIPVIDSPRRAGDPAALFADANKAMRELNWKPHYIAIDDVIETAWNWHRRKH